MQSTPSHLISFSLEGSELIANRQPEKLAQRIASLQKTVNQHKGIISLFQESISAQRQVLDRHVGNFRELTDYREKMARKLENQKARINNLTKNLDNLTQSFQHLEVLFQSVNKEVQLLAQFKQKSEEKDQQTQGESQRIIEDPPNLSQTKQKRLGDSQWQVMTGSSLKSLAKIKQILTKIGNFCHVPVAIEEVSLIQKVDNKEKWKRVAHIAQYMAFWTLIIITSSLILYKIYPILISVAKPIANRLWINLTGMS